MEYTIKKITDNTVKIMEYDGKDHVYMYVLVGRESALLIDTGFGQIDLSKAVKEITSLPVKVVLTHGHFDHIGGLKYYDEAYCHKDDEDLVREWNKDISLVYIDEDTEFDLGNRKVSVIHVPGHSKGSVCLYDENTNMIFTGDTACEGDVLLLFDTSTEPKVYMDSMIKLKDFIEKKNIKVTYPGHHRYPIEPSIIDEFIEMTRLLIDGKLELVTVKTPFGEAKHGNYKRIGVML